MSGTKTNPVTPEVFNEMRMSLEIGVPGSTFDVIHEVLKECEYQDSKWGEQNHSPAAWFAILGEEFGEVAKETVGITFAHPWSTNYRTELIQTAAVAVRMVEAYDRRVRAEDVRTARMTMVASPHELTDRQIKLLETQKGVPAARGTKGQISYNQHLHGGVPEHRDDPDGFLETHARQEKVSGS
jgi:hypothetical protein